jgi:hypothetical protein
VTAGPPEHSTPGTRMLVRGLHWPDGLSCPSWSRQAGVIVSLPSAPIAATVSPHLVGK